MSQRNFPKYSDTLTLILWFPRMQIKRSYPKEEDWIANSEDPDQTVTKWPAMFAPTYSGKIVYNSLVLCE